MSGKLAFRGLFIALFCVAVFQNCKSGGDPAPAASENVITDAGGLTMTITYDKTPATTDLDLYFYTKSTYSLTSNPKGGTIGPNDTGTVSNDILPAAPSDEYTVVVAYKTGTAAKPYTLSFKGITDKKTYTVSGSFAANLATTTANNYFGSPRGNNVTLKKAGNTYTITP
jgi:hypothetical protein